MTPFTTKWSRERLPDYLRRCLALRPPLALARVDALARQTIRYLTAPQAQRARLEPDQTLIRRWYAGLDAGTVDWGIYDSDDYFAELWACWMVYSRGYVRALQTPALHAALGPLRRIVDLGCGAGYTTAALAGLYPGATVIGTQLPDTRQMALARRVAAEAGAAVHPDLTAIPAPVDLVFASEYFEHIPDPLAHLAQVLALQPRGLLIANAFGTLSPGHFRAYAIDGAQVPGAAVPKRFAAALRAAGYAPIPLGLWNNRPTYYRRTG